MHVKQEQDGASRNWKEWSWPTERQWFQREASGRSPISSSAARTVPAHEAPRTFGALRGCSLNLSGLGLRVVSSSVCRNPASQASGFVSVRNAVGEECKRSSWSVEGSRISWLSSTQLPKQAMVVGLRSVDAQHLQRRVGCRIA